MRNIGEQMDLLGVYDEADRREKMVEPVASDIGEEEKIVPIIPEFEEERDCPACGGSGPCYACERGREVAQEFKKRQAQVSGAKKKGSLRKKAS